MDAMSLDPYLLAKARATARTLQDAERSVAPLREDHRACVRALHAGGGSLREIAAALGLSHQRVHQLVQGDAGSRERAAKPLAVPAPTADRPACELCGETSDKLTARPAICMGCRQVGQVLLAGEAPDDDRGLKLVRRHHRPICLACGRLPEAGEVFLAGPGSAICRQCLDGLDQVRGISRSGGNALLAQ